MKSVDFVKLPIIGDNPVNGRYISMIKNALNVTNIYYSHYEDLTKRIQGSTVSLSFIIDTSCKILSDENRTYPSTVDFEFMVLSLSQFSFHSLTIQLFKTLLLSKAFSSMISFPLPFLVL